MFFLNPRIPLPQSSVCRFLSREFRDNFSRCPSLSPDVVFGPRQNFHPDEVCRRRHPQLFWPGLLALTCHRKSERTHRHGTAKRQGSWPRPWRNRSTSNNCRLRFVEDRCLEAEKRVSLGDDRLEPADNLCFSSVWRGELGGERQWPWRPRAARRTWRIIARIKFIALPFGRRISVGMGIY